MNERIWELFKQSGVDIGEDQESNIEKFAELIVKECAGICEYRYSHNNADMSEGACEAMACSDTILEHFGVEE